KVRGNGLDRGVDELGPVEHRLDFNTGWEGAANLVKPRIDGSGHRSAVAADQHQGGTDHSLVPVLAGATRPDFTADRQFGHIANTHRHRAARTDNDLANFVQRFQSAASAHGDAFAVALDHAGAPADVVGLNRLDHVG